MSITMKCSRKFIQIETQLHREIDHHLCTLMQDVLGRCRMGADAVESAQTVFARQNYRRVARDDHATMTAFTNPEVSHIKVTTVCVLV